MQKKRALKILRSLFGQPEVFLQALHDTASLVEVVFRIVHQKKRKQRFWEPDAVVDDSGLETLSLQHYSTEERALVHLDDKLRAALVALKLGNSVAFESDAPHLVLVESATSLGAISL